MSDDIAQATVRWYRDDVVEALYRKLGRMPTDEEVEDVITAVDWRHMKDAMIETGWFWIDSAVDTYVNGG